MTRRIVWLFGIGLVGLACASYGAPFAPSERAGLGTAWGEDRASSVRWVSFEREDPLRPVEVVALHYDDADGVRAAAREPGFAAPPEWGGLRVRLVDAWGAPLPAVRSGGRTHVVGRRGERYSIEIQNQTATRVEAVATVDGLDVFDGGPGSFDKRGYVLDAGQTYRIDGFRQSLHEVAAFRFGDVSESYAAAIGDDANVGVIGVAFFAERRRDADPFPGGW
ncbi:MAG TPA: hypothetical protein VKQ32_03410 [Polyangia bacterium]|nr:hypothetical protein [Polyangia bacterium]